LQIKVVGASTNSRKMNLSTEKQSTKTTKMDVFEN
jgi:hypothetical protein